MKKLIIISIVITASLASCEKEEEILPSNFVRINVDGMNYTFIGRSIFEPLTLINNDTLKNTTYLGGFIGTCLGGSTQFIDIRINQISIGEYELSDGIEFWMETDNHYFLANDRRAENHELTLSISEYGDESGRISGTFSGINNTDDNQVIITGDFSLARLPDNSVTFEVASELCE